VNKTSVLIIAAAAASLVGFAPASLYAQASSAEKPAAPEKNPPGDIPDNQVFIEYRSPLGFKIKVPEGWARRETSDGATFNDKYNTIALVMSQPPQMPSTLRSLATHRLQASPISQGAC